MLGKAHHIHQMVLSAIQVEPGGAPRFGIDDDQCVVIFQVGEQSALACCLSDGSSRVAAAPPLEDGQPTGNRDIRRVVFNSQLASDA